MRRWCLLLLISVLATACSGSEIGEPPSGLASVEGVETAGPDGETNVMRFTIDGEPFELSAAICNTAENGAFQFALAQGELEDAGTVTATIERFPSEGSHDILIALEGLRGDGSSVTWYAQDPLALHEIDVTVLDGYISGTAIFDSVGGPNPTGARASGSFSVRCA